MISPPKLVRNVGKSNSNIIIPTTSYSANWPDYTVTLIHSSHPIGELYINYCSLILY